MAEQRVTKQKTAQSLSLPSSAICMSLMEINTRVWLKRFGPNAKLDDVPAQVWKGMAKSGMDMVWTMGVWAGNPDTVTRCCFKPELVGSYQRALSDFKPDDVIGSPYAIDRYGVSPSIGSPGSLDKVRKLLHQNGLRLILDFVPNHFGESSRYIKNAPFVFLSGPQDFLERDGKTFFRPANAPDLVLAHGKDPYFDAWSDTAQINYFSEPAVEFMIKQLQGIAEQCDGIRCDMAMLMLSDVFERTWGPVLESGRYHRPSQEFWARAIAAVKEKHPNFIFIAEAYWDMEWRLQQLGFDYTYDKRLYDRMRGSAPSEIVAHARADLAFQNRLVRFIENHDEERAVLAFGPLKSRAAAILASTLPGMRLYHDGQFDGKAVHLPVQLGREPVEAPRSELRDFYQRLLQITREPVFKQGQWVLHAAQSAGNDSHANFISYAWTLGSDRRLVVVNYADQQSRCHVRLDTAGLPERVVLTDQLSDQRYEYARSDLQAYGLFVELPPFGAHILRY